MSINRVSAVDDFAEHSLPPERRPAQPQETNHRCTWFEKESGIPRRLTFAGRAIRWPFNSAAVTWSPPTGHGSASGTPSMRFLNKKSLNHFGTGVNWSQPSGSLPGYSVCKYGPSSKKRTRKLEESNTPLARQASPVSFRPGSQPLPTSWPLRAAIAPREANSLYQHALWPRASVGSPNRARYREPTGPLNAEGSCRLREYWRAVIF